MREKRSEEDYQKHMHMLAIRISEVVNGEEVYDVASLFAGMCGFALREIKDTEERLRVCVQLQKYMFTRAGFECSGLQITKDGDEQTVH